MKFLQKQKGHKKSKSANSRPWVTIKHKKSKKNISHNKTFTKNSTSIENHELSSPSDKIYQQDSWKRNFSQREHKSKLFSISTLNFNNKEEYLKRF